MNDIRFEVPGSPVGAVRMTQRSKWKPPAQRYLAYREAVGWAARAVCSEPLPGAVSIHITIFVVGDPMQRSVRRWDLSNVLKAVEDGCNGICYADDFQVCSESASIVDCAGYADEPSVRVHVAQLCTEPPAQLLRNP